MILNYVRFENIFEFGSNYQITINDMGKLQYRLYTIPTGLINYFFRLPNVIHSFPFLNVELSNIDFYGFYYNGVMAGGLLFINPIIVFMLFIPKIRKLINKESALFIIDLVIVGFIMLLVNIVLGGNNQRYVLDFGWMFMYASIIIVFSIYQLIKDIKIKEYFIKGIIAIAFITIIVNSLLCIMQGEEHSFETAYPEYYYGIRYDVCFWE